MYHDKFQIIDRRTECLIKTKDTKKFKENGGRGKNNVMYVAFIQNLLYICIYIFFYITFY